MMEKSALAGEGGWCTPTHFHPITITYRVAVYAQWADTLPLFRLYPVCTLWKPRIQRLKMQKFITETQTFCVNCTSLAGGDDPGDEGAVAQPVLQGLLVGPVGPLLDLLEVGVGLAQASVEDRHLMHRAVMLLLHSKCKSFNVYTTSPRAGASVADPDPNPDQDPRVFGPPGSESGSFYYHVKIVRKTLIPTIL
jgi:hypothetical protein